MDHKFMLIVFYFSCTLSAALRENTINIPHPKPLPGQTDPTPFVVVADDAFPIKPYIMKPFPFRNLQHEQRIYNYRISRGRRVVENVFGICAARFRLLRRNIDLHPKKVTKIVLAICALHNFLTAENECNAMDFDNEIDGVVTPGNWRQSAHNFNAINPQIGGRNDNAINVRTKFMKYFSSPEGSVSWQDAAISISN